MKIKYLGEIVNVTKVVHDGNNRVVSWVNNNENGLPEEVVTIHCTKGELEKMEHEATLDAPAPGSTEERDQLINDAREILFARLDDFRFFANEEINLILENDPVWTEGAIEHPIKALQHILQRYEYFTNKGE